MESHENAVSDLLRYDEQYQKLKKVFRRIEEGIEKTPLISERYKLTKFETRLHLEFLDITYELSFSSIFTDRGLKGILSMKRLLIGGDSKEILIQQLQFDHNGISWLSQFDSWRLMDEHDSQVLIMNWLINEIKSTALGK